LAEVRSKVSDSWMMYEEMSITFEVDSGVKPSLSFDKATFVASKILLQNL